MKYLITIIFISVIINAQNRWEKLNGPIGGVIQSILVKGDTLLAGTGYDHALIFYSTNKGTIWKRANIKVPLSFTSFVTTEDGGVIAAARSNGLYKTFDLKNWQNIYNDGNKFVYLGKDFENNIYAGTRNNNVSIPDKIFISADKGNSWQISFDNYYSNISNFLLFEDNKLYAGGWKGILKKEHGLNTWSEINLDTVPSNAYTIFSDTSHDIYAFNVGTRMIMSSNSGNTWKYLDTLGFLRGGNSMGTCIFNNRLIGGLEWTGLHYALGVVVSDDGGYTWKESNLGMPPKISGVVSSAKSGNITYVGTSAAGVFQSTDYGDSWSPMNNGLTAARTRDICFDSDGVIYTANWSNGFQKSTDKGESWSVINNGLTNVNCYSIISDDNGNLFGGTDDGIFLSTDKGEHWVRVGGNAGNNYAFGLHKDNLNRIYALTYGSGVYRTSNLGQSWQKIETFPSGYTFGFTSDSTGLMLAGTRGSRIYRSTNYGSTWSQVYYNNTQSSVIGGISEIRGNHVYAINHFVGVLRSTDKGISWHLVKPDPDYAFALSVGLSDKGVFASGSGGNLFFSSDSGNTWNDVTDNIQRALYFKIRVDRDDKVYLATDESVWRSTILSTEVAYEPEENFNYQLHQNYPNPFNPSTKISYSLRDEGNVKLNIYDIKGELISTLVNEKQQAGNYEVDFTLPGSISTGVYIYRLTVSDNSSHNVIFSDVKKMVYLK